jgi:ABC-type antimicrobial peptide transport system permease subunit
VRSIDPLQPVQAMSTLDAVVKRSVTSRHTLMRLLVGFATVALVLAAVGVYAVTAQGVGQRTREIGVRMALGARSRDVLLMVLREEGLLVLVALVAGLAGAWATTRLIASSLYEVSATDPSVFAGVAVLLGLVAAAASFLPARRAARVDPVSALKSE